MNLSKKCFSSKLNTVKREYVKVNKTFQIHYLRKKVKENYNTIRFYFEPNIKPLPLASHITLKVEIDEEIIMRHYTPISTRESECLELLIKLYDNGVISRYFKKMNVGDEMLISNPEKMELGIDHCDTLGLIAGGTGIAPILQIIRHIISSEENVKMVLYYSNTVVDDILFKEELDSYVQRGKLLVKYFIQEGDPGVQYYKGHITLDMIKEDMPTPYENSKILICSTPNMEHQIKLLFNNLYPLERKDYILEFSRETTDTVRSSLEPPIEGECCNQSCSNCVWLQYINALKENLNVKEMKKHELERSLHKMDKLNIEEGVKMFMKLELKNMMKKLN